MILVLVAVVLLVGMGSGLLWWRLAGPAGDTGLRQAVGFDRTLPWAVRPPPRPDEGVEWTEGEEPANGWDRALKGLGLVVAVGVAAGVLAVGLYAAGNYLVHQVLSYFGSRSGL